MDIIFQRALQNTNEPSTSDEVPLHTPKKKKILNQLNNARQMIKQKDKQIKRLKEQNRRKVKKKTYPSGIVYWGATGVFKKIP